MSYFVKCICGLEHNRLPSISSLDYYASVNDSNNKLPHFEDKEIGQIIYNLEQKRFKHRFEAEEMIQDIIETIGEKHNIGGFPSTIKYKISTTKEDILERLKSNTETVESNGEYMVRQRIYFK